MCIIFQGKRSPGSSIKREAQPPNVPPPPHPDASTHPHSTGPAGCPKCPNGEIPFRLQNGQCTCIHFKGERSPSSSIKRKAQLPTVPRPANASVPPPPTLKAANDCPTCRDHDLPFRLTNGTCVCIVGQGKRAVDVASSLAGESRELARDLEERRMPCGLKLNCAYLSHPVRKHGVCTCEPVPTNWPKKRGMALSDEPIEKRDSEVRSEDTGRCANMHCPLNVKAHFVNGSCRCPSMTEQTKAPVEAKPAQCVNKSCQPWQYAVVVNGKCTCLKRPRLSMGKRMEKREHDPNGNHEVSLLAKRRFVTPSPCQAFKCPYKYHISMIGRMCYCAADPGFQNALPAGPPLSPGGITPEIKRDKGSGGDRDFSILQKYPVSLPYPVDCSSIECPSNNLITVSGGKCHCVADTRSQGSKSSQTKRDEGFKEEYGLKTILTRDPSTKATKCSQLKCPYGKYPAALDLSIPTCHCVTPNLA